MLIENLFPEPVGVFSLNRVLTQNETDCVDFKLKTLTKNIGNNTSADTFVLDSNELSGLKVFFLDSLNEFTKLIYGKQINLRITQSWLNISTESQFHHPHSHPNSFVSGVFFVKSDESDKIQFIKSIVNTSFDTHIETFNLWNSGTWWLPATEGSLVLFKSTQQHEVPPTTSQKRISLSFNTFFDQSIGDVKKLTFLPLV